MAYRLICCLLLISISALTLHAQTTSQPFSSLERAVNAGGGFGGDKSKLSALFDAERRRLGDKFEPELLKWLGQDVERHYWVSYFLEADSYLHGNKRLPHLSLLIKEQGLSLVRNKSD